MSERVLLSDVAKEAGVSAQTVSRVVRGTEHVSDRTRDIVQTAIEKLGYRPNLAARSLATNRTGIIEVVLAGPMFHGHAQAFVAISGAVHAAGYHVSFSIPQSEVEFGIASGSRPVLPLDVDAAIVIGAFDSAAEVARSFAERLPVVLMLSGMTNMDGISVVSIDQRAGAGAVVDHLWEQGIRDLVHLSGPSTWVDARERLAGFQERCRFHSLEPRWIESDTWNAKSGFDLTNQLIRSQALPRAIFAANDQMALGAMRALHEAGLSIPGEVAVVGFDDSIGASNYFPPLTTVFQDFHGLGREAIAALAALMRGRSPRNKVLKPTLMPRESSLINPVPGQ